jgi:hypothetical protein
VIKKQSTTKNKNGKVPPLASGTSFPAEVQPNSAYAAAVEAFMRASEPAGDDPDANYARGLAARLTMMAAEIEAGAGAKDCKRSRDFVQRMRRCAQRVDVDKQIALEYVVDHIEAAARVNGSDPADVARVLDALAKTIHVGFSKMYPAAAKKVDVKAIRAAMDAARNPKKGAPKWRAFMPIATAVAGVDDEEQFRKVLSRNRARRRA